ncbi:MAG: hypothetical protein ABI723_20860, partial [Bacteroidia bacterium]
MKKLITLIISFFVFSYSNAQVEIEWQKTIGGNNYDDIYSIKQTSDGGYILGGISESTISGDKTESCKGGFDYWIVKTDGIGNIQWQKTIGGDQWDLLISLRQTKDGGYILGGYSESDISGDKTENSKGGDDYWIVKTDSLGNIQWQNTIGGSNRDVLSSIEQTTDGGYILGGWSGSDISGDKTEYSSWLGDFWIVKIDSIGNIQWQNSIGGNNSDFLNCLHQTTDGGYILGGKSNSNISGDKTEDSRGDYDYWIVKTESIGNIQWDKTIGGDTTDNLNSILQCSDGGYVLGGNSRSNISGDKTENFVGTHGWTDYWIVKTDSAGNIQWQNTIGGNQSEDLSSLQQTTDGGYILGGTTNSNGGGDKTERSRGWKYADYWIIKIDSTGVKLWDKTIGGSSTDYLYCLETCADGNYILGGYSWSNISGDKSENSKGIADYWIVKLTDKYNLIKGRAFIDFNSNGVKDSNDIFLQSELITESSTNRIAFSGQNGKYSLAVLDSGNYSVSPNAINYYNPIPAAHSVNFNGINQTDSANNFAFQPMPGINDLQISITPLTLFRTGFNGSYTLNYKNVGTTTLTPSIAFYLNDNNYTYLSASITPSLISTDSVMWSNIILNPLEQGTIIITVHVNAGVPFGTQLNAYCVINPVVGDTFPGDNYGSWKVFVTGSIDPNDKLVSDSLITITQLASYPNLDYIIRFQNTGNDTAFSVRVLDNIPTDLDITSFQLIASSHSYKLTYEAHSRLMTFAFDNILLPDSNINELGSHGFIRYRIKPVTSLKAGDTIKNNAFIYFDNNTPVQTNEAQTKIVSIYGTSITSVSSSCFDSASTYNYSTIA